MADNNRKKDIVSKSLSDIWRNCVLGVKVTVYGLAIVFFVIGILALFGDAIGLGVFLIVVNVLLILFFRWLDRKADRNFDQEFEEMVRRNREE